MSINTLHKGDYYYYYYYNTGALPRDEAVGSRS